MKVRNFMRAVSEQFAVPFNWLSFSGIRSSFRLVGNVFWPRSHPAAEGTIVNYDLTRQYYRNSGQNALGAFFAKPIVDLQVGFMGIPTVTTGNDALDEHLNECITDYWAPQLQQMFRDSIRDSKVVVRILRPDILDPLMTMEEAQHCRIECLPPERVSLERNLLNKNIIERALVIHRMTMVISEGDPILGVDPIEEEHDVLEIVTRDEYRFYDQNTSEEIVGMRSPNVFGFVPFIDADNEYDAALQGGQSDLEPVIPFIQALHDLIVQGLQAHKYHSTPKVKLKLQDVAPFIKNNFPDAWDETTGSIKNGAEVSWQGREIIFLQTEDDIGFLEARSVLGDTKVLADFLIDCISIASQTPEWAFMRVDPGVANPDRNAQTVPFLQKIEKKRINFQEPVQMLCKMALVMYGEIPYRVKVIWKIVRTDDQFVTAQAFQQILMGLEVAAQRGEISDSTYRETIKQFLPFMQGVVAEKAASIASPPPQLAPAGNVPAISAGPQGKNE